MNISSKILTGLYRTAMRATGRRGSHTLGRLNARLFNDGQIISLVGGESFYLPPDPHFFGYLIGHEPHVSEVIAEHVQPGDTVFDVGANIGYFAVQMAHRAGADGRVIAYEVDETNLGYLKRNAELAALEGGKIEIVAAGVSSSAGTLTFNPGVESTLHKVVRGPGTGRTLPAVSIDDEVARLGIDRIGFLKIDVEGHEPFVLQGMDRTVREERVRAMVIEVMPGEVATALFEQFQSWRTHVVSVRSWIGGTWWDGPVKEIPWRTDTVVVFRT